MQISEKRNRNTSEYPMNIVLYVCILHIRFRSFFQIGDQIKQFLQLILALIDDVIVCNMCKQNYYYDDGI